MCYHIHAVDYIIDENEFKLQLDTRRILGILQVEFLLCNKILTIYLERKLCGSDFIWFVEF